MSWFRRFPALSIFLGLCLLAAIALVVLVVLATGKYSTISADYLNSERELDRLESAKVYPSSKNVELIKKERDIFTDKLNEFRSHLATTSPAIEPITPNGFQDKLRATVSAIQKLAADNSVELPDGFYLGFDRYQAELPSPEAAPLLSRQLDSFQIFFESLIQAGVSKITFIDRQPLPAETGKAPPADALYTKQVVELGFISPPESFRQIVNAISQNKHFLVLRTLFVRNENQAPPSKSDSVSGVPAAMSTPASQSLESLLGGDTASSEATTQEGPRLEFIVGQEKIEASLQIEIIRFPNSAEKPASSSKSAS